MSEEKMIRGMSYVDENTPMPENLGLTKGVEYVKDEKDKKEERNYLILLVGENRDAEASEYKDWKFITGRQEAYDFIKRYVTSEYVYIDVHKSRIISNASTITIDRSISVYKFVKGMRAKDNIVDDTSFDISDYAYEDEEENEGNGE